MNVLVSGASSGLGRYLAENYCAEKYDRGAGAVGRSSYDLIIHSAFNIGRAIPSNGFASYAEDTLGLTEKLLAIPHGKFVFVSTVDVYPSSSAPCGEDDTFDTEAVASQYGRMKYICETLVQKRSRDALILRPTAMLGPYIRPNSLARLMFEEHPSFTLSDRSVFNYILHADVAAVIDAALAKSFAGPVNLAATSNISLGEIAGRYDRHASFGAFVYGGNIIDNRKALTLHQGFARSSLENVDLWLREYKAQKSGKVLG